MDSNAFLFEDFAVTADSVQYIVKERKIIKQSKDPEKIGTETWTVVSYPSSLPMVFNYLAERTCKKHIGNLNVALKKIDGLRTMVKNLTQL